MMKSLATGDAADAARNAAAAAARRRSRRAMIAELVRLCGECAVPQGRAGSSRRVLLLAGSLE